MTTCVARAMARSVAPESFRSVSGGNSESSSGVPQLTSYAQATTGPPMSGSGSCPLSSQTSADLSVPTTRSVIWLSRSSTSDHTRPCPECGLTVVRRAGTPTTTRFLCFCRIIRFRPDGVDRLPLQRSPCSPSRAASASTTPSRTKRRCGFLATGRTPGGPSEDHNGDPHVTRSAGGVSSTRLKPSSWRRSPASRGVHRARRVHRHRVRACSVRSACFPEALRRIRPRSPRRNQRAVDTRADRLSATQPGSGVLSWSEQRPFRSSRRPRRG